VTPDDVKAVAPAVLAHRLVMLPASVELDETVVSETLRRVAVPIGG
jgi:hypothetical protein